MTGCGCAMLVALVVGLLVFMIFGSTDPGEPVEQTVALAVALGSAGMALVPLRRRLVRTRYA